MRRAVLSLDALLGLMVIATLAVLIALYGQRDHAQKASAATTAAATYTCGDGVATTDSTDICSLALTYLTDSLRGLQASKLYQQWAKANPGEVKTFTSYLALTPPNPWNPMLPAQAKMGTPFGAMLRDLGSICKVLLCPPTVLPNVPPATAYPDTKPPSTPTGLTATAGP